MKLWFMDKFIFFLRSLIAIVLIDSKWWENNCDGTEERAI